MEGIFSKIPHTSGILIELHTHFFKYLGLTEPLAPQEIPIPSVGGGGEYGYFLDVHNTSFWVA